MCVWLCLQAELEELLDQFEALALQAAKAGEVQRPSERRQLQQQQQGYGEGAEGGSRPAGGRGGYTGYDPSSRGAWVVGRVWAATWEVLGRGEGARHCNGSCGRRRAVTSGVPPDA